MDILILAAGLGKRMNSSIPKALQLFHQKEFIIHIIENCINLEYKNIYIVINPIYKNLFENVLNPNFKNIIYIEQNIPLGTGHALQCFIEQNKNPATNILILNGDMPNIKYDILKNIIEKKCELVVGILQNPKGYGRVKLINDKVKIIEDKDNKELNFLCNMGIYYLSHEFIINNIHKLNNDNNQKEYYITDLIQYINQINLYFIKDIEIIYFQGVNTQEELFNLENKTNL
jgi:bifunctional UDP-N-acetylglucosamine pyrophosphorylase/glucosamine-1-phosphate N-acetyltransferase